MSWPRLLARYAWMTGVREWARCDRVRPQMGVQTTATIGAMILPFGAFMMPIVRLHWLLSGKRRPGPLGSLFPPPIVVVNPFRPGPGPHEIRELLERPEYKREPWPEGIPRWLDLWARATQVLFCEEPTGLAADLDAQRREWSSRPSDGIDGEAPRSVP
jgi:hypothetical protein